MKLFQKFIILVTMLAGSASYAFDNSEVANTLLPESEQLEADSSLEWHGRRPHRPRPPIYRPAPRPRPPHHRPPPPHRAPGYGNVVCSAQDKGWEEHSRAHRSCGECLRVHGECTETCQATSETHTCNVVGFDRANRAYTFTGVARNRAQARTKAENSCFRSGYHSCRNNGCAVGYQRDVISRRSCR